MCLLPLPSPLVPPWEEQERREKAPFPAKGCPPQHEGSTAGADRGGEHFLYVQPVKHGMAAGEATKGSTHPPAQGRETAGRTPHPI